VSQAASAGLLEEYMSLPEKCPVCNTPWTTTRLVFSDIKHCKKCDAKAEDIMAKHKESDGNQSSFLDAMRYAYGEQVKPRKKYTTIKKDGIKISVPVEELFKATNIHEEMQKQRNIREEIDALYEKRKKNGMYK
jgi:hypothetical protein